MRLRSFFLPQEATSVEPLVLEFESYLARWGDALRWWSDADHEPWRRMTSELGSYPRRRLLEKTRKKARDFDAYAHGGDEGDDPHPMFLSMAIHQPDLIRLHGLLEIWRTDVVDASSLLEEALSAARRLQPLQGFAGLALVPWLDLEVAQDAREVQFAIAQQFEGIQVINGWFTTNFTPGSVGAVQWLTIVHDSILGRVGGRQVLSDLPEGVIVHDYGSGVVIQAGDAPSAGDVNKGETIPLYRAVARKLAPLRPERILPFNIEEPRSLGREETLRWYRRLEREP
jgi:hypothetical protein